jgi:hypothetical protein
MPLTSKQYRKKRNIKVAQMILEGKTDKEILEAVQGLHPSELAGMKGFLRKPKGIEWALQKGLIDEQKAKQLLQGRSSSPPSTPSQTQGSSMQESLGTPNIQVRNPHGSEPLQQPLNPPSTPPSPPPRVVATEEVAAVEVEGIPRKIKIGPKTLMFYQFFREGKIPGQQKPFEGDLGQFFDWVVNRYFTKFVGVDFVLRYEEEVAS